MKLLTNRAKQVDRSPMNFWEKIYLISIFQGMWITLKHFFKKKVTYNFSEETRPFSENFRGLLILNRDEEGRERCTVCGFCVFSCVFDEMTLVDVKRLPVDEVTL